MKDTGTTFFVEPSISKDISTPVNILGLIKALIDEYIKNETVYNNTMVVSSMNKDSDVKHNHPVISVGRGNIMPNPPRAPGDIENGSGLNLPPPAPGVKVSEHDSKVLTHFQTMNVEIAVYGASTAEVENLAFIVYKIILSISDNILSGYYDSIKFISEVMLTQVVNSKKYTDKYESYINFNVSFVDKTALIVAQNMIKYIRIVVKEDDSRNVVKEDNS